jgi:hypothetical protein
MAEAQVSDTLESLTSALDPEQPSAVLLEAVQALHSHVLSAPAASGKTRGAVLRALFRLLDLKDVRVLLRVIRTVLLITDKGPTLGNVSKLLFKLSRDERNDQVFREEDMAGILVSIVKSTDRQLFTDALVYASGTIKNLSNSSKPLRFFRLVFGSLARSYFLPLSLPHTHTHTKASRRTISSRREQCMRLVPSSRTSWQM